MRVMTPGRFYIMQLPGRGLWFDRITFHANVTQCLGAAGHDTWYTSCHAAHVNPDGMGTATEGPCGAGTWGWQLPPAPWMHSPSWRTYACSGVHVSS
jgi:hypothetical protein